MFVIFVCVHLFIIISKDISDIRLDFAIFSNKPRIVTYKCIKNMSNSGHAVEWQTFTSIAKDGTIGGLWEAAENCFKQAQLALDDWHIYIEDFEVQDDGTLELVTGS